MMINGSAVLLARPLRICCHIHPKYSVEGSWNSILVTCSSYRYSHLYLQVLDHLYHQTQRKLCTKLQPRIGTLDLYHQTQRILCSYKQQPRDVRSAYTPSSSSSGVSHSDLLQPKVRQEKLLTLKRAGYRFGLTDEDFFSLDLECIRSHVKDLTRLKTQKFIYMSPKLVVFYHRNQDIPLEDLLEKDLTIRCEILSECLHAVEQGTKENLCKSLPDTLYDISVSDPAWRNKVLKTIAPLFSIKEADTISAHFKQEDSSPDIAKTIEAAVRGESPIKHMRSPIQQVKKHRIVYNDEGKVEAVHSISVNDNNIWKIFNPEDKRIREVKNSIFHSIIKNVFYSQRKLQQVLLDEKLNVTPGFNFTGLQRFVDLEWKRLKFLQLKLIRPKIKIGRRKLKEAGKTDFENNLQHTSSITTVDSMNALKELGVKEEEIVFFSRMLHHPVEDFKMALEAVQYKDRFEKVRDSGDRRKFCMAVVYVMEEIAKEEGRKDLYEEDLGYERWLDEEGARIEEEEEAEEEEDLLSMLEERELDEEGFED